MFGTTFLFVLLLLDICHGNPWNARPVYVIERFPLTDIGEKARFPLKGSGSGVPFEVTPMETKLSVKTSRVPISENPTAESKSATPLPKLVKAISTDHKAKIKSLHTPCHQAYVYLNILDLQV